MKELFAVSELELLIKKLKDIKPTLQDQYGLTSIGLFGSYARGEQKKGSDVDVLVEFQEPVGLLKFVSLKYYLSELTGKEVDLVTKAALKPEIRNHVLKEVMYEAYVS